MDSIKMRHKIQFVQNSKSITIKNPKTVRYHGLRRTSVNMTSNSIKAKAMIKAYTKILEQEEEDINEAVNVLKKYSSTL
ncbi:MAG TPA: hypothetical protein DIT16_00110 [Clostridium sp.]|nr:hypothetical protein [Clostridium sp.]